MMRRRRVAMKKGDRVRINLPDNETHGWECTVMRVGESVCNVWVHKLAQYAVVAKSILIPKEPAYYTPTPSGNVYKPMTDANIASAVAKAKAKHEAEEVEDAESAERDRVLERAELLAQQKGMDRSAPWDAEAEYVFYTLLANEREG
jgi:hypothetical protein